MTIELTYLAWMALVCILMWLPHVSARGLIIGPAQAAGYPDEEPELPKWIGRARRAHANMVENLAAFGVLVLIAHVAGVNNEMTALGAALFFWGKLVHTAVFIMGIPYARTLAFLVAWIGMLLIFYQLIA